MPKFMDRIGNKFRTYFNFHLHPFSWDFQSSGLTIPKMLFLMVNRYSYRLQVFYCLDSPENTTLFSDDQNVYQSVKKVSKSKLQLNIRKLLMKMKLIGQNAFNRICWRLIQFPVKNLICKNVIHRLQVFLILTWSHMS